ncbi:MAG: prepilin-type N-terminal cleavage/methylation domain-containing protein [Planctomycetaceae bacterium]|nr:prepilin-type N-terminal cleavage/methylation domain-containing protein [Planctomycetaceae bacterium]
MDSARVRSRGMTLTELLVVIAVLAILVTLLMPSLSGVLSRTRMTVCRSNLMRIGQCPSLQLRDMDKTVAATLADPKDWYKVVLKDADNAKTILLCPESATNVVVTSGGTPPSGGTSLAEEAMRTFLRDYRQRITNGIPSWAPWLADPVVLWKTAFRDVYIPLDGTSYFARKINDPERESLLTVPAGSYNGAIIKDRYGNPLTMLLDTFGASGYGANAPQWCFKFNYEPGSNPYCNWIYAESGIIPPDSDPAGVWQSFKNTGGYYDTGVDQGTGQTWWWGGRAGYKYFGPQGESPCQNVGMWITHKDDGTTSIGVRIFTEMMYGQPNLVKKGDLTPDDVIVIPNGYGSPSNPAFSAANWNSPDREGYPKVSIGTPGSTGGDGGTPGETNSLTISYGINPHLVDVAGLGADKILAIDYEHLIVQNNDEDWADTNPSFARHNGNVNVLLRSGSVKMMNPTEIDPTIPGTEAQYWLP